MKKVALLIATFVLGTTTSSWALWGATNVEGTVKSIDGNSIIITEQKRNLPMQDVSFEVTDQTKFDDLSSVYDLQAGDQVKVSYKEQDDRIIATNVSRQDDLKPLKAYEPARIPAAESMDTRSMDSSPISPNLEDRTTDHSIGIPQEAPGVSPTNTNNTDTQTLQ